MIYKLNFIIGMYVKEKTVNGFRVLDHIIHGQGGYTVCYKKDIQSRAS